MPVIATLRPLIQAGTPPTMMAAPISRRFSGFIPGQKKVTTVASTMPRPAQTMPRRAPAGELIALRPRMNRTAARK